MGGWFRKDLGDGILAGLPLERIEASFREAYARAGQPRDMALFVRRQSDGRLHCEVTVYFAPAAAGVAYACGASPCARPPRAGLELLAGAEGGWETLFR
ncbi:MAG: hypothetical protein ACLGH6_01025 [Gammaproteobacteria bacterium]